MAYDLKYQTMKIMVIPIIIAVVLLTESGEYKVDRLNNSLILISS